LCAALIVLAAALIVLNWQPFLHGLLAVLHG
jgi:hypothetical protein